MEHDLVYINCDGGSRGNPGPAASGGVIWDSERNVLEEIKEKLGKTTNNVAEYNSLLVSLKAAQKFTKKKVKVFMDSELVIKQIKGEYRVKAEHLRPYLLEIKELEKQFEQVEYNYVPRGNKYQVEADRLVNEALDGF